MSSVDVWILPAVIAAAWILSWWGRRCIRWTLLSAGAVVSVLFVVTGFHLPVPSLGPDSGCTREQVQCMNTRPAFWLETGLFGFVCCVLLLIPTIVAEIVNRADTRATADSPR